MPKYENKCPQHNELDIYQGCSFNCIYCISHSKKPKYNFNLNLELQKIAENEKNAKPYYLSPWTDAYQHAEQEFEHSRHIINALAAKDQAFFVITKSTLIKRDIDYFKNRENSFIAVSLNTLNDKITAIFEPDAPSATERMQLIEELVSEKSIKTVVKIDPIIPSITDGEELEKLLSWLCEIKPYSVTAETLRLSNEIVEHMQNKLPNSLLDSILSLYDELNDEARHPKLDYRLQSLKNISTRLEKVGVKASFCKASVPDCITEFDCRGGYNYDY